jgi:acetyl-CoA C-acetyltransferase
MGVAAEYVAQKFGISKAAQDEYALLSYHRSWEAFKNGLFADEILAIEHHCEDEEFSKKRNMEALLKRAKPIFIHDRTVTAANSCGIHDGAAAVVVMEESTACRLGYKPILRFVDSQVAGVHPHYPGAAPIPAIQTMLKRNGLTIEEIDLLEINEAFASKIAACAQELSIPYNKLNVSGGALTIGHPYGASGAILVTRMFYEVQRRKDARFVIIAIGSGGGVGVSILFEVV